MHVWDWVTREQARNDPEGMIVGTRWVFVKKGDKVRCRLVAQEFAGSDKREDLYAGTPPLPATRYLLSDIVSRGRRNGKGELMVVDIKRAFLHGLCTRSIYIELPGEESKWGKIRGKLIRALYGTRDAPLAWLTVVKSDMKEMHFEECKVTNGVYTHRERDLRVVAHVNDFLLSGAIEDLHWFRDQMLKKYELKVQVIGWDRDDEKELNFLGRVIRATPTGVEIEGDDKHVEMLEKEWEMTNCNPVPTPYVKPPASVNGVGGETEGRAMSPANATLYRRAAARINYVALDRPDLSFASRVASSKMSDPQEGDEQIIKRIIRYLKGKPRVAIRYQFQEESEGIVVYTDSDWAGDVKTRKSTSGGVACRGSHTISWWCKLQSNIALSSCEAELNASLNGGSRRTQRPTTSGGVGRRAPTCS
mgnify:FL=1